MATTDGKYLNGSGLSTLWTKMKRFFVKQDWTPSSGTNEGKLLEIDHNECVNLSSYTTTDLAHTAAATGSVRGTVLAEGTISSTTGYSPNVYTLNTTMSGSVANGKMYIPLSTSSTDGVVKVGSDTAQTVAANTVSSDAGRTYAIQKNSSGQLVVNVPWTDTSTDISSKMNKDITVAGSKKTTSDVKFVNGTNTTVAWDSTNSAVKVNATDTKMSNKSYTAGTDKNIVVGTSITGNNTLADVTKTLTEGTNISITSTASAITISNTYSYTLPVASDNALGGFKTGFQDADVSGESVIRRAVGVMSQKAYVNIPYATNSVKGVASFGNTMSVSDGVANVDTTSSSLRTGLLMTTENPGLVYLSSTESSSTNQYMGYSVSYINSTVAGLSTAISQKAPLASPNFTGTPTISGTTIATTSDVSSAISSALTSVAQFKGVVNSYSAITDSAYKTGWYWIVGTAGTYAGQTCEVGDQIWAKSDKDSSAANTDFNIVQTNIDTDVYVRDDDFLTTEDIEAIISAAS